MEKNWEVFYFGLKKGREQYSVCCYCEWYEGISLRSSSWLQHRKEKSDRKMPTEPRPSSDMKRRSWNGYLEVINRLSIENFIYFMILFFGTRIPKGGFHSERADALVISSNRRT